MLVSSSSGTELPENSALQINYANPFAKEMTLEFTAQNPAHVRLEVFVVLRRRIESIVDEHHSGGVNRLRWDSESRSRGVYFVRMEVDGRRAGVQKIVRR